MKKFYLSFIGGFCFLYGSFAQIVINPITGGNFDAGNTFAANGWNVVNSSANKWVVGSATSFSPPNSAYISIDGNRNNYSYDNTTAHISHFYQKVTLPANAFNVTISFQLKGNLQNDASGNLADGLEVYADPSLTVPNADALPGGSAIMVYPQLASNETYVNQTITIPDGFGLAGKTFLVIFTWVNNGDGIGKDPPASVDDASISYCINSTIYKVTGKGAFCVGSPGADIGLEGSTVGISYQLYNGGTPVGNPVAGTGSAIDFGPQNVAGIYTIVGTSSCSFGVYTYPMTGSVVVTVTPLPIATAGSNAPLCLGATLNLTSGAGATYTYSWTGPNGFISTAQNPSITKFSAAASGLYKVTVTDKGCSATATTNVTVTGGGAVGGTISSVSICSGGSGPLTLSGNSNKPVRWESTTDSTSASWTSIPNVTATQNFSSIIVPTFYRAVVSDGCAQVYSDTATVAIHNYWTGTISSDWNTAGNWSDHQVPTTSCAEVYIPGAPNQPVLSGAPKAAITNLHIYSGASLTVNNSGLLQIGGTINNKGIFDVTDGTLELNGLSGLQNIDGGLFKDRTVMNLIISNNVNVANTPKDTLNISGVLSFGTSTAQLQTGDNITLKSSAKATANVGILAAGNTITGNVIVERYISSGVYHAKAWELLAVPTRGQTINQSWMEGAGATNISAAVGSAGNPHPGYGTMMTSNVANAATFPSPGFDVYTRPGPSIKVYNTITNGFDGPATTTIPIYNQKGYFVLVRGDRSIYLYNTPANATVLRTKGLLFTPANPPPVTNVALINFTSVGNPYASAIDLHKIGLSGGVAKIFTVWDPKLSGIYGLGAFQYLAQTGVVGDNNYYATPGTGSYGKVANNFIQSGQAFLVQATVSAGTVTFDESAKASGSKEVLRQGTVTGGIGKLAQLRADLYGVNTDTSTFLTDGNLIQYDESYSNELDRMDARKMVNSAENFGILSNGKNLAIERRQNIVETDTIFYNLTGVVKQNYRMEFTASSLSVFGLNGFVEDTYLKTRTPLNLEGITNVNYAVTNVAGSYAANRFMVVFKTSIVLPVTFVSLTAVQKGSDIVVEWKVENERNVNYYEVEKSFDGINFTGIAGKSPTSVNGGTAVYVFRDTDPVNGYNYYRIKSVDVNGATAYTNIVKVPVSNLKSDIAIYPNPITDGLIHLQLINQPKGTYGIRLFNKLGQLIVQKQINHPEGSSTELITWNYNLAHGVYQLEVTKPDGSVKNLNILY